jgi:predicted nucleic acid-binding protein
MPLGTSSVTEATAGAASYVVDASLLVEVVIRRTGWRALAETFRAATLHAPAHVDVEVMSALARLSRGGVLTGEQADQALTRFGTAPIRRHQLPDLVAGAWARTDRLRVADALYVELAATLGTRVLTTDARLARATKLAELIA